MPWWALAAVLTAWSVGIAAAILLSPLVAWLLLAAAIAFALGLSFRGHRLLIGLSLAAFLLGAGRGVLTTTPQLPADLIGQSVLVSGGVDDDPIEQRGTRRLIVRVHRVHAGAGDRSETLRIEATVYTITPVHYGDLVLLSGALQVPPRFEQFDYRTYLAEQGIAGVMPSARLVRVSRHGGDPLHSALFALRHALMQGVDRTLPEPQAALLLGVVFGYRSSLPPELQQQMIASGLVHIVVASGLNVALIARLVQQALVRFWRRAARLIALAAISGYTLLSGASPASLRAALMGGLVILGGMLGRRSQIAVAMAMSAALMLAIAPGLIRDVGFQLSFAATLGIVLFADGLVRSTRWLPGPLREPLATTLAAQAMTWPVLVAQVHQLSLIAPLSNLLVVPILPFMMVVGGLGAVAAIIVPIAGWLPLQVAGALAGWVVAVIQLSGGLPFATIRVPYFPASWLALAAILNGGTVAAVKLRQFFWQRPVWIVMLGTALMSAALLVVRPDGRVHVYALDVGTGSAVLIRTSHGHQVLIDGGPDANRLIQAMGRALPPTARTLDFWLISSGRRTEIGAASEVLSRFNVESVVIADPEPWSVSLRSLAQRVDAAGVRVSQIDRVLTIDGVTLRPAADQRTWLISVGASVLAIVPPETSWQSLPSGVDGAIFTAGGPMEWQAPGRGFSVIQVASNSRDGLPVRAVVQRLTGAPVYRTDQIGSVELVQTNAGFRPSLE